MGIVIILLLIVIIALLININHKLSPRDYVKEAMERDEARRTGGHQG
ncbi:hypothetical protein [Paenibacillus sp. NPDC058071]